MQKHKKQAENQNSGAKELRGGELEKTSGGAAVAVENSPNNWSVCINDFFDVHVENNDEFEAKALAENLNRAISKGKFHDMCDWK